MNKELSVSFMFEQTKILLRNQDKYLLLKKPSHAGGFWETPGGKLEEGESPKDAAHRELNEETGISCDHFTPLGILLLSSSKTHIFLAQTTTSEVTLSEEHEQFLWVDIKHIKDLSEVKHKEHFLYYLQLAENKK